MKKFIALLCALSLLGACSFTAFADDADTADVDVTVTADEPEDEPFDDPFDDDPTDVNITVTSEDPSIAPEDVKIQLTQEAASTLAGENVEAIVPYGIAKVFEDVKGQWYESYVMDAVEEGLLKGSDDGLFHGEDNVTRAELGTILYRFHNNAEPTIEDGKPWYATTEAWLRDADVIDAFGWKEFEADKALTREEVLFMIYSAAFAEPVEAVPTYKDMDNVSAYTTEAVKWASAAGLVKGDENNCLNPTDNVTRAETATILIRYSTYVINLAEEEYTNYESVESAEAALGYKIALPTIDGFLFDVIVAKDEEEKDYSTVSIYGMLNDEYPISITEGLGDRDLSNLQNTQNVEQFNDEEYAVAYQTGEYSYAPDQTFVNANWSTTDDDGTIHAFSVTIDNGDMDTLKAVIDTFEYDAAVQLVNPMKEYESVEAAAAAVGYEVIVPEIEGLEIYQIFTYNEEDSANSIVRIDATLGDKLVEIRQGLGDRNISGIYASDAAMVSYDPDYSVVYTIEDREALDGNFYMLADWNTTDEEGQIHAYSVFIENCDIDTMKPFVLAIGAEEYADDDPIKNAKG